MGNLTKIKKRQLSLGGGIYVPHLVSSMDFPISSFTWSGETIIDGLDLSLIVPAGAIGIILGITIIMPELIDTPPTLSLFTDVVNYPATKYIVGCELGAAPGSFRNEIVILPIMSDRLFDYLGEGDPPNTGSGISVLGWFI